MGVAISLHMLYIREDMLSRWGLCGRVLVQLEKVGLNQAGDCQLEDPLSRRGPCGIVHVQLAKVGLNQAEDCECEDALRPASPGPAPMSPSALALCRGMLCRS